MNTTNEISAAQLAANQANAQKSTGPRTEEGKAVARFNARRHGLTGQFYCMSAQDEEAYDLFEAGFLKDLRPVGHYENQIAIAIIQDYWRLNRSRATESNLYGRGHDQRAAVTDAPESTHAAATMADTHRDDHRVFANIALYETRIQRMISRNEKRLAELQAERKTGEKQAAEKAELLLRFADFVDDPAAAAPELTVDGFVFSTADLVAKIKLEQRLECAKICAASAWDASNPRIKRLMEALKAA